ncbi:hypothetical protein PENSTE_c005G02862 [Penicillium steckii]|uniref:Hydrophobin n=1 Tax=Penicillium steckii TaxID=303698 RepID=A0A1V6TK23_9EURO|nr:hypothetical protein PENSTE_c005G02862 [Penicillium steckii]
MRFSIISVLSLVGADMVAASPMENALSSNVKRSDDSTDAKVQKAAAALAGSKDENESETSDCVGPLLCCGSLTTPLDPIVDPILEVLGVDAANIVGSIGLLCHPYEKSSCDSAPQCCTEANLLGGTVALGCAALKD